MTISRRLALSCASAFAVMGGTAQSGLASALKGASALFAAGRYRNLQTSQRFEELLIHRDESGHTPHSATISIASTDTAWFAIDTLDELTYRTVNHQYKKRGYRLRRVSAFRTKAGLRYSGIWEFVAGPEWHSSHGMRRAEFDKACADYAARGCRMSFLDARAHYCAIWERGDNSTQQVFASLTLSEYEQQLAASTAQGLRPTRISPTAESGVPRFAAIFEKNTGAAWQAQHLMSAPDFHKAQSALKAQGYRLTDASGYLLGGKPTFAGIWEKA